MAPSSSIQFIETAFSCTTPFALSYSDPDQKWIIRQHLVSLLQYYPSFRLSSDRFTHNNGTTVNLLNVTGSVRLSHSMPSIPLIIWLHENYPNEPPLVFVSPDPTNSIHRNHAFVDSSGATVTPYIIAWQYPSSNLSDLVRNMFKLFSRDHPFAYSSASGFTHPSLVSKREAIDRLTGMLHYDVAVFQANAQSEIEELSVLQEELRRRVVITDGMITGLDEERGELKQRVKELTKEAHMLANWVRVNDPKSIVTGMNGTGDGGVEEAFEAIDGESQVVLDSSATDLAIDDTMYALDRALENGVLGFDFYIKQVRSLAREQFYYRAQTCSITPR
ncbi:hypothetical protein SLEP1_g30304 [Rubroshorea leprosula]|uniref:Protein ELC-like n=1 Tax=Rubroshorea leprosula TaxID=152421 RepID=A0AAV5K5M6_9ROSI|nr:hypothetical protein SLEP1_g30304 [Rubroshorea leprosula]